MATSANRYATDWNGYSAEWERRYGTRYEHLGDEWCDDGTADRRWEERLFAHSVAPWLTPGTRALEIGPGGGKWTSRLAPLVHDLVVFDVAEEMLERTKRRVASSDTTHVSFQLGNGRDLAPLASDSFDLVFSYDVFVHIALEDTLAYVAEIARVLRDGGVAILHHAISDVRPAWDRIESHNEWYRERPHSVGQYYYFSRDMLDRMYAQFGLRVESAWTDYCTTLITARKPADSAVPRLEQALRQAALATEDRTLDEATRMIADVGQRISARLGELAPLLRGAQAGPERYAIVQRIRSFVRG